MLSHVGMPAYLVFCHCFPRAKRQSIDDSVEEFQNISSTAILTNDSHFHALVHWTGFPHENIFILTRQLTGGVSGESWLWR